MKLCLRFLILIFFIGCKTENVSTKPVVQPNLAYQWGQIALECTANNTDIFRPRPTVTSRMLALVFTSVFDAWTRYDNQAAPLYLSDVGRRPSKEHTLKNKETAISYAAYRALITYFAHDSIMLKKRMIEFGFDPDNYSLNTSTPIGIGNLAAKSVIEKRLNDGSNQLGNTAEHNAMPYTDYTGYAPINTADTQVDIMRWQPKYFSDGKGGKFAPGCLTPHWNKVVPMFLDSANQFRPPPPPKLGSTQLGNEVRQVIEMQAALSNEQKALVEFMRDGPKSVQQAGHWLLFAQNVSVRDKHTLDEDVLLYFIIETTAMDAFIACWDAKMFYDYARPYALVHEYFKNETITGWGGAGKGMVLMKGSEWKPYSPETFVCPPFSSYVSGHSTVSSACAEILKLFTGDDFFGEEVKRIPGAMTEPENVGPEVTLKFSTFTQTAEMAGLSRVLGGYHIQCENIEGLKLGKKVADVAWNKYLQLTGGNKKNGAAQKNVAAGF